MFLMFNSICNIVFFITFSSLFFISFIIISSIVRRRLWSSVLRTIINNICNSTFTTIETARYNSRIKYIFNNIIYINIIYNNINILI